MKARRAKIFRFWIKLLILCSCKWICASVLAGEPIRVDRDFVYVDGFAKLSSPSHLSVKNAFAAAEAQAVSLLGTKLFSPQFEGGLRGKARNILQAIIKESTGGAYSIKEFTIFKRELNGNKAKVCIRIPKAVYNELKAEVKVLNSDELSTILERRGDPVSILLLHELNLMDNNYHWSWEMDSFIGFLTGACTYKFGDIYLGEPLSRDDFRKALSLLGINDAILLGEKLSVFFEYRSIYAEFLSDSGFSRLSLAYREDNTNQSWSFSEFSLIVSKAAEFIESSVFMDSLFFKALVDTRYPVRMSDKTIREQLFRRLENSITNEDIADFSGFLSILEGETISGDALNLMGRMIERSSVELSIIIYHSVAISVPEHPYALTNMTLALSSIGYAETAKNVAKRALASKSITEWGRRKLMERGLL